MEVNGLCSAVSVLQSHNCFKCIPLSRMYDSKSYADYGKHTDFTFELISYNLFYL